MVELEDRGTSIRHLDAQVAERVFGYVNVQWCGDSPGDPDWYGEDPAFGLGRGLRIKPYSTDWNAAAEVIEHLRDHGAGELRLESHGWRWVASFSGTGQPGECGKTGPEAICRAALAIADARPCRRG